MIKGSYVKTETGHNTGTVFIRRAAMVLLLFFICMGASLVQANADSKTFKDSDGGTISDPNTTYTIKGSVMITLSPDYLDNLENGEHELSVSFNDGSAPDVSFTVTGKKGTDTGDNSIIVLWLALLITAAAGLAVMTLRRIRSQLRQR